QAILMVEPSLDEKVFEGMSKRDIARLLLHTRFLQYQQHQQDRTAVGRGFSRMLGPLGMDPDEVHARLVRDIELLAPIAILNETPIQDVDKGFLSTAGKALARKTTQEKAQQLTGLLADYNLASNTDPAVRQSLQQQ